MAKRRSNRKPVMISEKELLPKMEFLSLTDDGKGFYVKELGGKALLEYNEYIEKLQKESGDNLTNAQGIDLMVTLVFMTACKEDGTPYFASKEKAEVFGNASLSMLQLAQEKAMEMSGIQPSKEVADNLKNAATSSSTDS